MKIEQPVGSHAHRRGGSLRQRGAATLIVVMVLFFVMSMVAAYTSRNLIFEQKTSANQLRSTQAAEAAEAGLQWALGLLNSGRIDSVCLPSVNPANTSFRQRYLSIDGGTGAVTPVTKADGSDLLPSCVFNGLTWNCSCPINGDPAVAMPPTTAVSPAFRVRFTTFPARPQLVRIEVNGCTKYADSCLNFAGGQGADNEARAYATALLSLKGAVSSTPAAAVTARTTFDVGGSAMKVYNSNPKASGITIQAGGVVNRVGLELHTIPGSLSAQSVVENDSTLQFADFLAAGKSQADAMFVATFGMQRNTYRDQPGAFILDCGGICTAAQVRTAGDQNPGRIIWVNGDLSLDGTDDVGSVTDPLAIVATGSVTFASNLKVYGLVYSQAATWNTSGTGTIVGAAIGEGSIAGTSTGTVAYDAGILDLLRYRTGSVVIVPGTWKDF